MSPFIISHRQPQTDMNRRLWRVSTALFVSLLAWTQGPRSTYSCGSDNRYLRYETSYFRSDLATETDSIYRSYLPIVTASVGAIYPFDTGDDSASRADNVREWGEYFGGLAAAGDIATLIYQVAPTTLDAIERSIVSRDRSMLPGALARNSAIELILRRRDHHCVRYLRFVRRCAPHVSNDDPWAATSHDTVGLRALLDIGQRERDDCSSPALRLRYAYQLVRLAHYGGFHREAIELYDRLVARSNAQGIMRYWALGHKAGALMRSGATGASLIEFARIFDRYEPHRERALREFRFTKPGEWDSTLAFAADDHERATVWMIRALVEYRFSIEPLRRMRQYEPGSPRLMAMFGREVRRVERDLFSERVTRPRRIRGTVVPADIAPPKGHNLDWIPMLHERVPSGGYARELRQFALESVARSRVFRPEFWYMAAGYLALGDGDLRAARSLLATAQRRAHASPEVLAQTRAIAELTRVRSTGPLRNGAAVGAELDWLRRQEPQYDGGVTRYRSAMIALGQRYLRRGDVPRATLAFHKADDRLSMNKLLDIYATHRDLRVLERMIARGGRTPLDRLLLDSFPLGRNEMLDLRGTRLLRVGRSRDALSLFRRIAPAYWVAEGPLHRSFRTSFTSLTGGRAFLEGAELPRDRSDVGVVVDKLSLTERIVELERRARRSRRAADSCYFQIANALRNSPYWGYSGVVWKGSLVGNVGYYHYTVEYPFNVAGVTERMHWSERHFLREYGIGELAWKYYRRVASSGRDRILATISCLQMDAIRKRPLTDIRSLEQFRDSSGHRMINRRYRTMMTHPAITSSVVSCELD
jgi:hypothetical protein